MLKMGVGCKMGGERKLNNPSYSYAFCGFCCHSSSEDLAHKHQRIVAFGSPQDILGSQMLRNMRPAIQRILYYWVQVCKLETQMNGTHHFGKAIILVTETILSYELLHLLATYHI
jgi:hypothetical protein